MDFSQNIFLTGGWSRSVLTSPTGYDIVMIWRVNVSKSRPCLSFDPSVAIGVTNDHDKSHSNYRSFDRNR